MTETTVGGRRYRIAAVRRESDWIAHAEEADTGDRFGIECAAPSEDAAVERSYHRTVAGSAFANPTEGPSAIELQKESLDAVEAARLRLDEVRARRPE
jgi:hypothetical protein